MRRRQRLSTACRIPGTRRPRGWGHGPQKCSPASLPRAPGTQSGSRGRESDVCELLVQTGKRTAHSVQRHNRGLGAALARPAQHREGAASLAGAVLGSWPPGPRGRSQPPVLGARSAAWITWPQGREHCRVGPSRAGLPPRAQPPCPVAVVHPLSLSLQWGPGPCTDPRPVAHGASAPKAGQGCLPCWWPRWG